MVVPAGLSGVTAIAAGYAHTVALKNDGSVVAWGPILFPAVRIGEAYYADGGLRVSTPSSAMAS